MMTKRYTQWGPVLAGLGYDITPVNGKRPILEGWSQRPDAAQDFDAHGDAGIGVLCGGEHNLVAVDCDVVNPFLSNTIRGLIEEELGTSPRRVGKPPKFLMVYRCTDAMKKVKTGTYEIDGSDCQVEVLAEGQQFVASGIHPDTQEPYQYPDDSILDFHIEDLIVVTPEQIQDFLHAASVVMSKYGPLKGRVSERSATPTPTLNLSELDGEIAEVETALAFLPNDDEHYDDWIQTLHAIKGALGEAGYDLAHRWSRRSDKYDEAETDRAWCSIKDVRHIGAGSIFHWASEHGFDLREMRQPQHPGPANLTNEDKQPSLLLRASEIKGPLPQREWLLDQWFPSKAVSALFGQGGVGKTLLVQQLANCVATGSPFLGIETKQMPVLMVLCEDDALEISRRQLAINDWLQVNEITGTGPSNLFIWPRVGEDNILVTWPQQGEDKPGEFYGQLCEQVQAVKTDQGADELLLVLDTAADVFGGNENIRREVNTFIKTYCGSFCTNYDATVLMLAHPSMSGMASGSGMSGSTAWENSVRARAYFSRSDDADDVRTLSRKKSNYSQSGDSTDMTLLWDQGVYQLPSSPTQIDRIENRALKNRIIEAVSAAAAEGKPFQKRTGRKILDALPAALGERRKRVQNALTELELSGEITFEPRVGYRA